MKERPEHLQMRGIDEHAGLAEGWVGGVGWGGVGG